MGESIQLYRTRSRRRLVATIVILAVVAAGTVVALNISNWTRYESNGSPRLRAADLLSPIERGQEAFHGEEGRYAATRDELLSSTPEMLRSFRDAELTAVSSDTGDAYLVTVRGFDGSYAAVLGTYGADPARGVGATSAEASARAGFTDDWATTHGFLTVGHGDRAYGAMAALPGELIEVRLTDGRYVLTRLPYPTVAEGYSWQEAISAAGGDPAKFTWDGQPSAVPANVTASDDSATMRVVADGSTVRVRLQPSAQKSAPFVEARDAVAAAEIPDGVLEDLAGTFTCSTQSDEDEIHSLTLCQLHSGAYAAYGTMGTGASDATPELAFNEIGADDRWLRDAGLRVPTTEDLL